MTGPSRRSIVKAVLLTSLVVCTSSFALAQAGTLADIKQRGKLTVGTEAAYEPYEFVESGKVVGYGHDILEHMAAKLGVELEQLNLPFNGLLPGLMSNKFDFVATSVGITPERAKRFAFSQPIGIVRSLFVVKADNTTITQIEDAAGKVVGTQMGSSSQHALQEYERNLKASKGQGYAELKLFQGYPDVGLAIANGSIDVGVLPSNVLAVQMRRQPDIYKTVGGVGDSKLLAWVVNARNPEVRTFINETLDEMRASGKLAELQQKWFGETLALPTSGYLPEAAL
ncbi:MULTISPECIES: transporter substrate-binding domain-containing protein [Pseudomonas]|uniref:Putative amino-acid-binding protein YxeM n=1 Tax=Pseudomonas fluorescens TaxID=294 RepID=A0A5E7UTZ7_PSEFL|nr:transporter substrate-binding domain-containing protein [Pseudomonas fluorescens]VVQ12958.1 putative amino-acid-binding protein YxeM [Pseudomonas fluorescens]